MRTPATAPTAVRRGPGRPGPFRAAGARARWPWAVARLGVLGLAALAVLLLLVASLTTEWWYWSRIVAWRDAGFYDFRTKFPARPIPNAPAPAAPFAFRPAPAEPPPAFQTVAYAAGGREVSEPLDRFLATTGTTALLVVKDDALLVERYANGSGRDATQTSFSVAKSFASALVGIAIQEGAIGGIEDPIVRYLPELAGRGLDGVRVRHLLTMSSGLRYSGEGAGGMPWQDDARTYYDPDLRRLALTVRPAVEPGTRWQYNNYHPLLIGLILERATGRPVATYLSEKLWRPLGAEAPASWSLDSAHDGFEKMESGLNARAVDFARFGRLFLKRGAWQGVQLVPAEWVDASTRLDTTTDPADFYQYFWWVDTAAPGRYFAAGNFGQFIYVAPDRGAVVLRFGERYDRLTSRDWVALLRALADRVG